MIVSQNNTLITQLLRVIADVYGIDQNELTPQSDLNEEVGVMGSVDELAQFVHSLNQKFDIDLHPREVAVICEEDGSTIQDLVYLIQDAMLG
jgi:acyl carrier protein